MTSYLNLEFVSFYNLNDISSAVHLIAAFSLNS